MRMQRIRIVKPRRWESLVLGGRAWLREGIAAWVSSVGVGQPSSGAGQTELVGPGSVGSLIFLVRGRHEVIEESEAGANGLFSITGRVPSHADARFKDPGSVECVPSWLPRISGKRQAWRSVDVLARFHARDKARFIKVLHTVVLLFRGQVRLPTHA